jgi:Deltex C-terminal domain
MYEQVVLASSRVTLFFCYIRIFHHYFVAALCVTMAATTSSSIKNLNNFTVIDLISDDEDDRKPTARETIESSTYDLTLDDDTCTDQDNEEEEEYHDKIARTVARVEFGAPRTQAMTAKMLYDEKKKKKLEQRKKAEAPAVGIVRKQKTGNTAPPTDAVKPRDPPTVKVTRKDPPTVEITRKDPPTAIATKKGRRAPITAEFIGTITYMAPLTLASQEEPFKPVQPSRYFSSVECACCLETLTSDVVAMNVCKHQFHAACIREAFQITQNKCPECMTSFPEPKRGNSPSGSMSVSISSQDCSGYPGAGTIHVTYTMHGSYRRNSCKYETGSLFRVLLHSTYLPNTCSGKALLKRLEYAFQRGLSFLLVLDSIDICSAYTSFNPRPFYIATFSPSHKAILTSTMTSWHDPFHIQKCHQSLDSIKVPGSEVLRHDSNISFGYK